MKKPSNSDERLLEAERIVQARLGGELLDLVSNQAVANIYRAASSVRRRAEVEVLGSQRLTWGGFTILFVLWVWGGMQATALAAESNLAKGTLSGMLDTLERRELVERTRHQDDKRRVVIDLTASGHETIETIFPAFNAFEGDVCGGLITDERLELARLLRIVARNVDSGLGD